MPEAEHRRVAESAKRRGLKPGTDAYDAYVFGTLEKIKKRRKEKAERSAHKWREKKFKRSRRG